MRNDDFPRCHAVVASYNPANELVRNVRALLEQLPVVTVVDNGSREPSWPALCALGCMDGCNVIRLEENRGIAAALNLGVQAAIHDGARFIFTFDQDSLVEPGFVHSAVKEFEAAQSPAYVALVAPVCVDRNFQFTMTNPRSVDGEILEAITSGSMIPNSVFQRVGLFDEKLFMDFVDIEFCLRCRHAGFRIILSPNSVLHHSIGQMAPFRLFNRTFYPSNHSSARRYYIMRNRVYLMLRYTRDFPWIWRQAKQAFAEIVKIVLMEDHKLSKLGNSARGAVDGLFGRLGKRVAL